MIIISIVTTAPGTPSGAVIISGIGGGAAALIAIWGVLTQRAMARRRATMDHLAKDGMDKDMIEARKEFIRLAKEPGGLAQWADLDKEATSEAGWIRLVLNDFELIAVSIQFGIMDFDFYKRFNHGTVKRYWERGAPYIHALRHRIGSNTVYAEFQQLHEWVAEDSKRPKRSIWLKKLF